MKKNALFFALFLLTSCQSTSDAQVKRANDVNQGQELEEAFDDFFSSSLSFSTKMQNEHTKETYHIQDEVSSSVKYTKLVDSQGKTLQTTYIISSNGTAYEYYLDLSNSLKTRELDTGTSAFKDTYGSPFNAVIGEKSLFDFFTVQSEENKVTYTANETGLARLTQAFNHFFPFYNQDSLFDTKTVRESLISLQVNADSTGKPNAISFEKMISDRYGAIVYSCESTVKTIESVTPLTKHEFSGTSEERAALENAFNSLVTSMSQGNFTSTIQVEGMETLLNTDTYHNYYDFTGYGGAMICDYPLYQDGYGVTYVGLARNESGEYYRAGVSPEVGYVGETGSDTYSSFSEVMPQISSISPDFFIYNAETQRYSFDIDSFLYDDYYFSLSILTALLGEGDPFRMLGYYLSDSESYAFDFHSLEVDITSTYPTFYLDFECAVLNSRTTMQVSFSEFGEVNLANDPDLSTAYNLLLGE